MHYWVQQFESNEESFEKMAPETQWLTVNMEDKSQKATSKDTVFIHFGAVSIEVRPGVNMIVVADIVHVLQNQC